MSKSALVIGAGVGGLTAAHELVERGYRVTVVESARVPGGKSASQPVGGTGTGGRKDLPGEHGFRFFPRFYRHVIDSLERIPDREQPRRNIAQNLISAPECAIAAADGRAVIPFTRQRPRSLTELFDLLRIWFGDMNLDGRDVARFVTKLLQYLTSGEQRRLGSYEKMSFWQFTGGPEFGPRFHRYLRSLPRTLVAMDAERGSARTLGGVGVQMLLLDLLSAEPNRDRIFIGPSSEMWLEHWHAYLERRGVTFRWSTRVTGLTMGEDGRISAAEVEGSPAPLTADHYVAAVPIEVLSTWISPELCEADPALARLREADLDQLTDWMSGLQFYLHEDVPIGRAHIYFPDSPWALTAISQAEAWSVNGPFRRRYGNGEVGGILSVDVAQWNRPGRWVRKRARDCSADEIATEVWSQLKAGLNVGPDVLLRDTNMHSWHLDDLLVFTPGGGGPRNEARLLVHPPGSWAVRPEAASAISNLVLASDFVRTYTDLATMESANEAARRAVNAILDRDDSSSQRVLIWPLSELPEVEPLKRLDDQLYESGRPHVFEWTELSRVGAGLGELGRLLRRGVLAPRSSARGES